MEDRYLFKAKRIKDAQWIEGYLIYSFTGVPFIITEYDHILALVARYEIDTETICQCTGLKDENGKLIWENDIVVCRDFTEENYVISWKQDEACFEYQQYGCSIMNFEQLSGCEVEVIGNKFDNPELLEV